MFGLFLFFGGMGWGSGFTFKINSADVERFEIQAMRHRKHAGRKKIAINSKDYSL